MRDGAVATHPGRTPACAIVPVRRGAMGGWGLAAMDAKFCMEVTAGRKAR